MVRFVGLWVSQPTPHSFSFPLLLPPNPHPSLSPLPLFLPPSALTLYNTLLHAACGLEYCVTCEPAESPGSHDECLECLQGTVLFEGECFACPESLIARTAIVQEAEEEAEERANLLNRIECEFCYSP